MLLRLRLLVTGALLLWFFLLAFGFAARLLSSPPKAAKEIAEAPAVESKAANLPHQKKTPGKNIAEVAAPATARWEP